MGSKDDEYFVRRYKAGKKEVFFAINSGDDSPWVESFLRVVRELGLGRSITQVRGVTSFRQQVNPALWMTNSAMTSICEDDSVILWGPKKAPMMRSLGIEQPRHVGTCTRCSYTSRRTTR